MRTKIQEDREVIEYAIRSSRHRETEKIPSALVIPAHSSFMLP